MTKEDMAVRDSIRKRIIDISERLIYHVQADMTTVVALLTYTGMLAKMHGYGTTEDTERLHIILEDAITNENYLNSLGVQGEALPAQTTEN